MDTLFKELPLDQIDFSFTASQQFATVIFDRKEDSDKCSITIFKGGKINQFEGNNDYNTSGRRHSSSVYVEEEGSEKVIKISTRQHKGDTSVEVHGVSADEMDYLFGEIKLPRRPAFTI